MEEQTSITTRSTDVPQDSRVGGVSVRAWLVMMLCGTVCVQSMAGQVLGYFLTGELIIEIKEPLYSLSIAAASYYFGQTMKKT
jgi:hypothetical protein